MGKYDVFVSKWPSPFVARTEISAFTGGIISEKYLANLDSAGKGPAGRVRIGRKIAYPVSELIIWLEGRENSIDYEEVKKKNQRLRNISGELVGKDSLEGIIISRMDKIIELLTGISDRMKI